MPHVLLKMSKSISASVALAVLLTACSTSRQLSEPQATTPPPPLEINVTNPPPIVAAPESTNAPVNPLPAPLTNAPPQVNVPVQPAPKPNPSHTLSGPKWLAWETWSQDNGWGKPERLHHTGALTYELKGTNGVLEITAGNRTALWNGLNLELGFVPHLTNGQPFLHKLDLAKTFEPLTLEPPLLHRSNRVIVIDPGHGGENYGAKSVLYDHYEKEYALDWAFRLEKLLKYEGWKVYLTRTNDADVSLAERIAFADTMQADLFISLHFNSSDQPQSRSEQGGIETYCLTPVGMPSSLTRQYDDESNHLYPNNAFDLDNYYFATHLHRALVQTTQRKDRGVRRARFMGILRGQHRPAVLIEGGYLTQALEARLIGTPEYRQKLAEAVAQALAP